jgi:hypothetical protein
MKRLIKGSGIVGLAMLILVYLAEILTGQYLVARPGHFPADMFVTDKIRGLALSPDFNQIVKRVRSFRVHINPQGYRDRDWNQSKPRRVLLVGSSATFGFGLDRKAGIAAKLEEALGPEVSVLNSAVYSYGPPQALATIKLECPKWRPQLVVYMHEYKLTRVDFLSNRGATGPIKSVNQSGTFGSQFGWRLPSLRKYLSNHGFHPTQVWERVRGLDQLDASYIKSRYAVTGSWGESCRDCTSRAATLIAQMPQAAAQCGADFIMAVLPGPGEAYYGFKEPATTDLLNKLAISVPTLRPADLRNGIPLASVLSIPGLDYFNVEGGRLIAGNLAHHIRNASPNIGDGSTKRNTKRN